MYNVPFFEVIILMEKFLWQHDLDFQFEPRETIDRLQEAHLLEHVNYCLQKSPFYSQRFGKTISKVTSLTDFIQLEFTTKDDLLKHNMEFLAVPKIEIVDTCFTSATVGTTPVNFLLTKNDLARLVHNEQVAFEISGITREDTVAVCVALERGFMAGLAYFLGGVELGAHMIRIGASGAQHIWELLKTHRPTAVIGVPSVLANVAIQALEAGENPAALKLERIMAIGESTRDKQLKQLAAINRVEQMWQASIYSTYASTEMATSFAECRERQGGHCRPEMIYVEIIDEQGNPVQDGEIGEVVVTPLGVQGMPLFRFRTGDMSFIISDNCGCGRTTRRIGPVIGRKAQLLKYKGTNVFPNAIVSIVEANPDFFGCYVEAYEGRFGEDRVVAALVPANHQYDLDKLKEEFRAGLRVVPELRLIDETEFRTKTQPAGKRKRQIFFDMREEKTF
jgi:phenylacetate-CoA ligase